MSFLPFVSVVFRTIILKHGLQARHTSYILLHDSCNDILYCKKTGISRLHGGATGEASGDVCLYMLTTLTTSNPSHGPNSSDRGLLFTATSSASWRHGVSTNHIVLFSVPLTDCLLYRNVDDYMIAKLHTGISATS